MNANDYKELVRLQNESKAILARRVEIAREVYSVWCQRAFEKAFGTAHSNELQKLYDTLSIPYNNLKPVEFNMEIIRVDTFEKHLDYTNRRSIFIPAYAMTLDEEAWANRLNETCEAEYNRFIKTIEGKNV